MIENVEKSMIDSILSLYENEKKTNGDDIKKHEYDGENQILIIYYENPSIAKRVINKGKVEFLNKTYQAKKYKKIKSKGMLNRLRSKILLI